MWSTAWSCSKNVVEIADMELKLIFVFHIWCFILIVYYIPALQFNWLYAPVCVCVCVYVCVCVCVYVFLLLLMCVFVCFLYVCLFGSVYVRIYVPANVGIYVRV